MSKKKSFNSPHNKLFLFGWHACEAALNNKARRIKALYLSAKVSTSKSAALTTQYPHLKPIIIEEQKLYQLLGNEANHQGIALEVEPLPSTHFETFLPKLADKPQACIIILDQVTDIQNIGTILRAAAVFAIDAIILPKDHAPEPNATMAKLASGALEQVPLIYVTNIARTMEQLKKEGFWCYGLAEEGSVYLHETTFSEKAVLIFGAEGRGMRHNTKNHADHLIKIPTSATFSTLNVATSVAITLYQAFVQHKQPNL